MSEEIITKEKYWNNGNLYSRENFKNGEYHGICEWWLENGNLGSRFNYKDGNRHGLCERWWSNGTLISKKYYFNGEEVTEFEFDVLKTCGEFENE